MHASEFIIHRRVVRASRSSGRLGAIRTISVQRVAVGTIITDRTDPHERSLAHAAPILDMWRRSGQGAKDASRKVEGSHCAAMRPETRRIGVFDYVASALAPRRGVQRKTRGRAVRYSFLVGLFNSLLHAGLSRRTDPAILRQSRDVP